MTTEESKEEYRKRRVITPDGVEHIVSLPIGHWKALDWLSHEGFTDFETQVEIAWNAWSEHRHQQPDIPFEQALGYAIQEADVQYESWKNGFVNDNE